MTRIPPLPQSPSRIVFVTMATAAMTLIAGCTREPATPSARPALDQTFISAETLWRIQRQENLLKPDGWLSLVGLHWITLKAHFVGSSAESGIRLAKGPAKMGLLQQQGDVVAFTPEQGVALTLDGAPFTTRQTLRDDEKGTPSVIGFDDGRGEVTLISRGGRHALRVRHADADTRTSFMGLDYWVIDPAWQVSARYVANPPGKTLPVVDIIGVTNEVPNPGAVEFERNGKTWRIEAMDEGDGELFLVFADRTNGHGSYGAGRFLDAGKPAADGRVLVDFNRAYNPPCAFTAFATCPLPPKENRLDLAIAAGEKAYAGGGH